jgi:hypothetical protein
VVNRIAGIDDDGTSKHKCGLSDALTAALTSAQEVTQKIETRVATAVARGSEDGHLLTLLRVWIASPFGRHVPRDYAAKGDLLRWVTDEGMRLPTVRDDLADDVVAGKVEFHDVELVLWLATKLDARTRAGLLSIGGSA